ncbi:hypothetical protein EIP86_004664 [Pleurotus ostreatoroseus]|nr:hypothetical protein EIP86_004664 [Pleurotus ostreatoroseus]
MSNTAVTSPLQAIPNQVPATTAARPATDQVPKKLFIDDTGQEDMYVYVALNAESIPDKQPELQPHTVLNHFDIYHAHYLYDQFHWTAFMPKTLEFEGRILECLKYTTSDVPYVAVRGNDHGTAYRLSEWMLENLDALWNIVTALHRSLTRLRPTAPSLNTGVAPSPQSCGYDRLFSEHKDLVDTYIQARDFFTFHLCYVSYLLCLCTPPEDTQAAWPSWFVQLEEPSLTDISIYYDLKDTWVFDLAIPRLGGFVDMEKGASSDPNEDDDRFVVAREFEPKYEELSAALQEKLREKTAERKAISWDDEWSGGIDESIARYRAYDDDDNVMDFDTSTQQFCFIDFFQAYDYAGSPLSFGVSFPETNYRPQTTEALQNGDLSDVPAPTHPCNEVALARPCDEVVRALAHPYEEVAFASIRPDDEVAPALTRPCDEIAPTRPGNEIALARSCGEVAPFLARPCSGVLPVPARPHVLGVLAPAHTR